VHTGLATVDHFSAGAAIFLFFATSAQPRPQWVPAAVSQRVKRPEPEAANCPG